LLKVASKAVVGIVAFAIGGVDGQLLDLPEAGYVRGTEYT
jgi:hypothetical protein